MYLCRGKGGLLSHHCTRCRSQPLAAAAFEKPHTRLCAMLESILKIEVVFNKHESKS